MLALSFFLNVHLSMPFIDLYIQRYSVNFISLEILLSHFFRILIDQLFRGRKWILREENVF